MRIEGRYFDYEKKNIFVVIFDKDMMVILKIGSEAFL